MSRQPHYSIPLPHMLTNVLCAAALTIQHSRPLHYFPSKCNASTRVHPGEQCIEKATSTCNSNRNCPKQQLDISGDLAIAHKSQVMC